MDPNVLIGLFGLIPFIEIMSFSLSYVLDGISVSCFINEIEAPGVLSRM